MRTSPKFAPFGIVEIDFPGPLVNQRLESLHQFLQVGRRSISRRENRACRSSGPFKCRWRSPNGLVIFAGPLLHAHERTSPYICRNRDTKSQANRAFFVLLSDDSTTSSFIPRLRIVCHHPGAWESRALPGRTETKERPRPIAKFLAD